MRVAAEAQKSTRARDLGIVPNSDKIVDMVFNSNEDHIIVNSSGALLVKRVLQVRIWEAGSERNWPAQSLYKRKNVHQ
jgi:hypothetical protein